MNTLFFEGVFWSQMVHSLPSRGGYGGDPPLILITIVRLAWSCREAVGASSCPALIQPIPRFRLRSKESLRLSSVELQADECIPLPRPPPFEAVAEEEALFEDEDACFSLDAELSFRCSDLGVE